MERVSNFIGMLLNWTTASWVTIFGGATALLGITLFSLDHNWAAIGVLIISFLTDWWDGALARYQQGDRPPMTREEEFRLSFFERINYKGVTHTGRALDPLIDKVRFIGLLWVLGLGFVPVWMIATITALAVILTLTRPLKRFLKLDPGGSNKYGKYKVYAEVVTMAILVFTTRPLYGHEELLFRFGFFRGVIYVSLSVALLLAIGSLYGHIKSGWEFYRARLRRDART